MLNTRSFRLWTYIIDDTRKARAAKVDIVARIQTLEPSLPDSSCWIEDSGAVALHSPAFRGRLRGIIIFG